MVAGTNDAPGLFSITNGVFICAESCCARTRISTSTEPPAAEPRMKRMGFSGYAACAAAHPRARSRTARARITPQTLLHAGCKTVEQSRTAGRLEVVLAAAARAVR